MTKVHIVTKALLEAETDGTIDLSAMTVKNIIKLHPEYIATTADKSEALYDSCTLVKELTPSDKVSTNPKEIKVMSKGEYVSTLYFEADAKCVECHREGAYSVYKGDRTTTRCMNCRICIKSNEELQYSIGS